MSVASVEVPATVANLGPGFDVLGAALPSVFDRVSVRLHHGEAAIAEVKGRDANLVPLDPKKNAVVLAAQAVLNMVGDSRQPIVSIERQIPIAAGLGSSAAASVGGALATVAALECPFSRSDIIEAALAGEASVAGRHLDNIAPCLFGGVTIVRSVDPIDVHQMIPQLDAWLVVATPEARLDTRAARSMLPDELPNPVWIQQMANTATLVYGLMVSDAYAVASALEDGFAEPARKHAIPMFDELKTLANRCKALGCGIAGAGPSVFALCEGEMCAKFVADAWGKNMSERVDIVVGKISGKGARVLK